MSEMTNSEIKCEHRYEVLIELGFLGQWCSVCGAFKGQDHTDWQLPTRTPEPTKAENGLVALDENVMEAVIWQYFNPEAGTVRRIKDWSELSKHICSRFGSITKEQGGCPVCGTPCDIVGHTTKHYEPKISKEQLLAILPKKKDERGCRIDIFKAPNEGFNLAIDQMKQRIEDIWK